MIFLTSLAIGIPLAILSIFFKKAFQKEPKELKYFYDPENWQD